MKEFDFFVHFETDSDNTNVLVYNIDTGELLFEGSLLNFSFWLDDIHTGVINI